MRRFFFLCVLAANLALFSCESGVVEERIAPENLVAVSALISPQDSIVRVYVYQGKALGDIARSDLAVIKDAKVTIEGGGMSRDLVFETKTNSYAISNQLLKVRPSKQYKLQVTTKTGVLKATCVMPPDPEKAIVVGVKSGDDYGFSLEWPAVENVTYFSLGFELKDVIFKPQLGASSGPQLGFILGNNLFNNKDRANQTIENKIFNAFRAERISLKTTLYSMDENAFNYLKTRSDAYSWSANTSGLIPNLREPQSLYSNIEGGVGIFGAYNQSTTINVIK